MCLCDCVAKYNELEFSAATCKNLLSMKSNSYGEMAGKQIWYGQHKKDRATNIEESEKYNC